MEYGIREHALYYACLARAIMEEESLPAEQKEPLLKEITQAYGIRRGRRMRDNAHAEGLPSDLHAFFVTGEWEGWPGENRSQLISEEGMSESRVDVCAWYDTWKKYGLLEYGKYYCRWIDQAIAEGFSGSFRLTVLCTKSQGGRVCRFVWDESAGEPVREKRYLLPFSYHLNELRKTAKEVLRKSAPECMDAIMKKTENLFSGLQ